MQLSFFRLFFCILSHIFGFVDLFVLGILLSYEYPESVADLGKTRLKNLKTSQNLQMSWVTCSQINMEFYQ